MSSYSSKAFVYYSPGDVRVEEMRIGCSPTDIMVKITASARCGTDRTIFCKGHPKVDSHAPNFKFLYEWWLFSVYEDTSSVNSFWFSIEDPG